MNKEEADALIGQMAADSALLRSLCATLIGLHPDLAASLRAQVEATALLEKQQLQPLQQQAFQARLQDLRGLFE